MTMTRDQRLQRAIDNIIEMLEHGARIRGHALPPGFALERARNIAGSLVPLFEDAREEGYSQGYKDGMNDGIPVELAEQVFGEHDPEQPS